MSNKERIHSAKMHTEMIEVLDSEEYERYVYEVPRVYSMLKRTFDLLFSAVALTILSVPLLIAMLAVYIDDPGPVLFTQHRVGLNGELFRIFKLRSMKIDTDPNLSTDEVGNADVCITRVGKFIRKYSIDELPQLINVLIGDMSIVGPRPLIPKEFYIHYKRNQYGVYSIRPGLTGLAQIMGRDFATAEQKISWDVKYLETFGFMCDIKILLKTIPKVLKHTDVVEGSQKE